MLSKSQCLANSLRFQFEALGYLIAARFSGGLIANRPRCARGFVYQRELRRGKPDDATLRVERAGHRLPDPPHCVSGEPETAPPVEFLDRPHQTDVAFLNQIEKGQAPI